MGFPFSDGPDDFFAGGWTEIHDLTASFQTPSPFMSFTDCLQSDLVTNGSSILTSGVLDLPYYWPVPFPESSVGGKTMMKSTAVVDPSSCNSVDSLTMEAAREEGEKWKEHALKKDEETVRAMKKSKFRISEKKERGLRFAFTTKSEVDNLEDGYRWRKYGQKALKQSSYPRLNLLGQLLSFTISWINLIFGFISSSLIDKFPYHRERKHFLAKDFLLLMLNNHDS